jgi:outer membrane receptor protein involved in Fe transport
MKKLTVTLGTLFLWCSMAMAQSNEAVISGTVIDENDQPISTASVAVFDSSASDIITGAPSDSTGSFEIDIEPGNYVLKVTFLSFKPYTESFSVGAGDEKNFGNIAMSPTAENMGEITVRAESSQMEMSFDKRVFNVGQDITSLGGSAVNVLDNVPSIATDIDGNISLRGNESVRVLINGKPSSMVSGDVDALRSIPATMIKEVEIITNPSSKYAAEGSAGIINIILKKKQDRGLNGSVSAGGGYPEEYEGSVNLNYRTENINWFIDTGADYRSEPEEGSSFQRFAGPQDSTMYSEQTDASESEIDGDLRFGADFYLSDSEVLTASSYISLEEETNNEDVRYIDYQYLQGAQTGSNASVLDRTNRNSVEEENERNFDFNLDYENKIEGDEHKLVADASFDISRENAQSNITQNSSPVQRSEDSEEEIDLRFNAEYERPLGENGKLEAGLRSDSEWMENDFSVDSATAGNNWQPQPQLTQRFLYSENVNAAFLILGGEFGNFSGQIGVRAENTNIRTEIEETGEVNEQHYLNLFPSVFLNYSFNEQQSVQISYSRRLRRPWSRSLLPFIDYGDPRSQYIGNPNLTPEFSNSYEAGYLHYWESGSLLTSFYYRHRTDVIERITELRDGVRFRFPINFATESAWGVEFSADQDIGENFSLSANANLFRSQTDGSYENQVFDSNSQNIQGRMRLQWEIVPDLNYQASMRYRGPSNTPQGSRNGMTMMDSGIAYDLMDGKAKVTFNVRDILNSQNYNNTVTTDGNPQTDFYSNSQFSWSTRSFSLNFQYFFGERQNQQRGRGQGGDY